MGLFFKFLYLFSLLFFASCSSKNLKDNIDCFINPSHCPSKLTVSPQDLLIKITGPSQLVVNTANPLNLVGICNEGAYPDNYIKWRVTLGKKTVLRSKSNSENKCKEGRFKLNLDLRGISIESTDTEKFIDYKIRTKIYGFNYNAGVAVSKESSYLVKFKVPQ